MMEIAEILKNPLRHARIQNPDRAIPSIVIRAMAIFDKTVRLALNDLDTSQNVDNTRYEPS